MIFRLLKTIQFLFLILVVNSLSSFGQNEIIVEYNINNGQLTFDSRGIKKGEALKVRVTGINTAYHKLGFKFTDYELVSKPPDILKTIFPDIASGNLGIHGSVPLSLDELKSFMNKSEVLFGVYKEVANTGKEIKKKINSVVDSKQLCVQSIVRIDDLLINEEKPGIVSYSTDSDSYKTGKKSDALFSIIADQMTYLLTFYEILKKQTENLQAIDQQSVAQVSMLTPYYLKLKKIRPGLLSGLATVISVAENGAKIEKASDPHLPKKDIVVTEIYITNRFNPGDTITFVKEDLFVKNKVKIDFSVGISANTLVEKEYYFTKTDSIVTGVDSETPSQLDFGVAALLHIDWRVSPTVAIGPVAGLSVSVIDAKPRYMLGFSTSIGQQRSLSLSLGYNFGYVKVLSKQISSDGNTYNQGDITEFEEVPTTNQARGGLFFAVTYNLTRTREK